MEFHLKVVYFVAICYLMLNAMVLAAPAVEKASAVPREDLEAASSYGFGYGFGYPYYHHGFGGYPYGYGYGYGYGYPYYGFGHGLYGWY